MLSPEDLNVESMSFVVNDGAASIASDDPRGPWVLFGDGHVFRLSPKVEATTLRALVTIDGGEAVSRDDLLRLGMLLPL